MIKRRAKHPNPDGTKAEGLKQSRAGSPQGRFVEYEPTDRISHAIAQEIERVGLERQAVVVHPGDHLDGADGEIIRMPVQNPRR